MRGKEKIANIMSRNKKGKAMAPARAIHIARTV